MSGGQSNNDKTLIKDGIEANYNNNNNINNKLSICWRAGSTLQVPIAKPLPTKIKKNVTVQITIIKIIIIIKLYQ